MPQQQNKTNVVCIDFKKDYNICMALIKCNECGKEISSKATVCPNCGAPVIRYVDPSSRLNIVDVDVLKSNDDSWAKKYKNYKSLSILIYTLITLAFAGVYIFCFLSIIFNEFSVFYMLGLIPTFLLTFLSLSMIISASSYGCFKKATYNGYTLVISITEVGFKTKKKILINNKEYKCDKNQVYYKLNEENSFLVTLSGKKSSIKLVKTEQLTKPIAVPNGIGPVVITNYVKTNDVPSQNDKNEKTDMEKKMIKNAKIDALASINPNDTEDAKEKIKIYQELDNLDTK